LIGTEILFICSLGTYVNVTGTKPVTLSNTKRTKTIHRKKNNLFPKQV